MPQLLTNVRIVFSTCALCKETNALWPAICKGVTTTMGKARRSSQVQKCSGGRNGNSWVILLPARDVMLLNFSLYIDPTKASSLRKIFHWLYAQPHKKASQSTWPLLPNRAVFAWQLKAFEFSMSKSFSWAVTQMDLGKRSVQTPCSENRNLCGLHHPAMGRQAAHTVGKRGREHLTSVSSPAAAQTKCWSQLFTFRDFYSFHSAFSCVNMWVQLHCHSSQHCALEWLSGSSNWDATFTWWGAHTHTVQGKDVSHRVNSEHKAFSNHLILLPFYKMQIKKIMKQ